ncbi:Apoptosis-stimulating of p53 protein 2 [Triplophysa tibetana]|uniref:Apoptosis-stimulating of p53 protein 2 n=1 Tax=Triplophysa tibetana TaxID=1572043 RepID=A0A5A9P6H3_9TELE|nr:Apoptosis-stimulating of p53 protein 2 [Triplophysa tibetana]
MMPMFLTVYLSNNDQHFTEVPITPETVCRDVIELCKEPGQVNCHLTELWRGSERTISETEKMLDLLLQWGQARSDVGFFLRNDRTPSSQSGCSSIVLTGIQRMGVNGSCCDGEQVRSSSPWMDMTVAELQEMAARQQQQIDKQQQVLSSKEQRLHLLKQQEHRPQQASSEQEKLQCLKDKMEKQEAQLKAVRALKSQVEQKRLSNGKLVEEIGKMNSLLLQKQRELVVAVSKAEELSKQLETVKNGQTDMLHNNQSSVGELDRLYRELQMRKCMNQDQNSSLQQQRENLNRRNQEVAAMGKRVNELRDRLWKKKAALQQKENLPVPLDNQMAQQTGLSRVAAVGPYIQSSTMPKGSGKQDRLIKTLYPEGTAAAPHQGRSSPPVTGLPVAKESSKLPAAKPGINQGSFTLPRMVSQTGTENKGDQGASKPDRRARPVSMFESIEPPAASLHKNQSSEDLVRDAQTFQPVLKEHLVVPGFGENPNHFNITDVELFLGTNSSVGSCSHFNRSRSNIVISHTPTDYTTLFCYLVMDNPCRAILSCFLKTISTKNQWVTVHFLRAKGLDASNFYRMQTFHVEKLVRSYIRGTVTPYKHFYVPLNRPVCLGTLHPFPPYKTLHPLPPYTRQESQNQHPDNPYLDISGGLETVQNTAASENQETERIPRPLSPTKLLPFISNPYRHQSDVDLEALRKKLFNAPRPLKKRSSITEPEGPGGPNIQKLLYQKATLAAMETTVSPSREEEKETATEPTRSDEVSLGRSDQPLHEPLVSVGTLETKDEDSFPPPPSHPAPRPDNSVFPLPPQPPVPPPPPLPESLLEEFPPYPPPPYPSGAEQDTLEDPLSLKPPEVTGLMPLPPGKRTNLRKSGSERIDHDMRVQFNPLALLLDSSLEGEFDLVQRLYYATDNPSQPNDEGITALHNAVCAGHTDIVKFLVQYGANVNAADSDGWTPLHCAASCNNVQVCKFLVESGAAVFAMTHSDMQTAADKCEEMEDGYSQCSQFLYGVQEKMGIMNRGVVYGLWDYESDHNDELPFREGDCMTVIRREDEDETEWWWAHMGETEGYIPRNLLGLYPRIRPRHRSLA